MAARQLYESSMRDPLTDLYNRRFFDQRLREEFAFATRHQAPLSVILLDLDHFKQVNDTWGHPAGDEVLRQVAGLIKRCVRKEDVASRFGGEEFAVVVRTESHEGARAVAERMRKRIEDTSIHHEGELILVTTSAGVATAAPPHMYESPSALLAAADQALYRAKAGGRNRSRADRGYSVTFDWPNSRDGPMFRRLTLGARAETGFAGRSPSRGVRNPFEGSAVYVKKR